MVASGPGERAPAMAATLALYGATFTCIYLTFPIPLIHQVTGVP